LLVVLLLPVAACAANEASASPSLADQIARADSAYRSLPISLSAYNSAVLQICKELESVRLSELKSGLKRLGVSFDSPKVGLPLRRVEVPTSPSNASAANAGIPVVAGYDTRGFPLYPPEGLFVDATAIYDWVAGRPRLSLRYQASVVMLNGRLAFAVFGTLNGRTRDQWHALLVGVIKPAGGTNVATRTASYSNEWNPRLQKTPFTEVDGV
jgi:hypothetical protein